jgi:tRNA A-37 threonylcarbamoyl transferase component Bud32
LAQTVEQFGKALAASGLMAGEDLKAFWGALKPEERPRDGDGLATLLVERGKLTKFQAQELLAGRGAGLVMGDYLLLAEIGAGGMGKVYKAQHRRMKRVVALKVMSSAAMQDDAAVKRFQREVEAAARLEHPNIVTAYDSGEAGKVKYLVMQFVDGGDLSDFVKKHGPLPIEAAVGYVKQAAHGLAFAHAAGVVHRDIKPANLLLDKKGVVKILDMGLARIEDGDGLTATEQVMGTVDYMSPEQAAETKNADGRSDIYSLGCTLWFLLSAKKLYDGDTMISRLMKHRDAELPSLVKTRDDATWPLEQVLHKMIAKRPQDRYQSMDEVVAALEPFAGGGAATGGGMGSSIGGGKGQSAELASFMQAMAGAKSAEATKPAGSSASVAVKPATSTAIDATAAFSASEIGTDPKSQLHTRGLPSLGATKPQAKGVRKKSPPVKLIAGGLLGTAVVLIAGIIVTIKNKDGEVVAELSAPTGTSVEIKTTAAGPNVSAPNVANSAAAIPHVATTDAAQTSPPPTAMQGALQLPGPQLAALLDAPEYRWSEPENLGGVNSRAIDRLVGVSVDESSLFLVRDGAQLMSTTRADATVPFPTAQPFPGGDLFRISQGDATISADGLTLVLLRGSPRNALFWSERRSASEPFSPLREVPESERLLARHSALSADGLTLLAAAGGGDVFMWTRPALGRPFEDAQRVPSPVSSREWDMPTYVSNDRLLMIVMGQIGEGKEVWRQARYFWRADVRSPFAAGKHLPVPLGAADGNSSNSTFLLSQDGQRIYLSSPAISGGRGGLDIWISRRIPKGASSLAAAATVVYLDDLPEVEFRVLGNQGLGKHGKFREQAGAEREILFRGKPIAHTLWMHPPQLGSPIAFARYQLDGRFATFAAEAGIPDGDIDPRSPVEFRVLGDGRELWKSPALAKRGESAEFSVNIQGVKELRLEVSRGDKNGNCHATWLMPRLTPVDTRTAAAPPASDDALDRKVAQWLLDAGLPCQVIQGAKKTDLRPGSALPAGPLMFNGINATAAVSIERDKLLAGLADFKRLNQFKFSYLPQRDCDLWAEAFAAMPNILAVNAAYCAELTDVGAAHLAKLPKLGYLNISGCPLITRVGLAALEKCSSLDTIELDEQSLAAGKYVPADVQKLQDALPKARVVFSGLKPIPGLKPAAAK